MVLARAAGRAPGGRPPRPRRRGDRLTVVPPGDDEVTTQPLGALPGPGPAAPGRPAFDRPSAVVRLFGSDDFFRLWLAQVVSALGDWICLLYTSDAADE